MARINLLPWRETLRKEKEQELGIAVGVAVVITVAIMGLIHVQISTMSDFQHQKNNYIKQEITAVSKKIEEIKSLEKQKEHLLSRMTVIQELQKSRPQIVHLFDEMINVIPPNVYIETLRQTDSLISLTGLADSNAGVSSLMRNVTASEWLANPVLDRIVTGQSNSKDGADNRFNIAIQQQTDNNKEK